MFQTVTVNSALSQNRVGCTMHTPRTYVEHTLCSQCPGRGRCCTHDKQVVRACSIGRARLPLLPQLRPKAQVVTPNFNRPGRNLKSMLRPAFASPTETPLSRPKTLVATPNHHQAARTMSRHQIGVATPLRPLQVANSKRGRDLKTGSRHRFSCPAPSQVATPNQIATLLETNLCRDIDFMSRPRFFPQWISKSRHQKSRSRPPPLPPMS